MASRAVATDILHCRPLSRPCVELFVFVTALSLHPGNPLRVGSPATSQYNKFNPIQIWSISSSRWSDDVLRWVPLLFRIKPSVMPKCNVVLRPSRAPKGNVERSVPSFLESKPSRSPKCNVPFVYPTLLSYRGQGSSAALHMVEYTDGRSLYQAACDRAYHGVIAIGHW